MAKDKKGPEILDLDKLVEDKRIVKLGGKEINVSKIPTKISLQIAEEYEDLSADDSKSLDMIMDYVIEIINSQNEEKVDRDWIVENTDINQLIALLEFVMEPIQKRTEKLQSGNQKKPPKK